jgi:hypothetical protein
MRTYETFPAVLKRPAEWPATVYVCSAALLNSALEAVFITASYNTKRVSGRKGEEVGTRKGKGKKRERRTMSSTPW